LAESSIGWTTDGTGDGSASGYTMAQFTEWQRMLMAGLTGADLSGVAPDYLNKLAVTGTSTPVAVNTGGAIVYGFPYFNNASVNVAVSTPSVSTRIDRVVLRASWAAQTVRIALVAGAEGGAAPALTQTAGTTWEMSLATVSITTGGVITVTDTREWLTAVGDGTVTQAKLATPSPTTTIIPLIQDPNSPAITSAWGSFTMMGLSTVAFDASKIPSNATVKFGAIASTNNVSDPTLIRLAYRASSTTQNAVTGGEVSCPQTSSETSGLAVLTADLRANLPAGVQSYCVQAKKTTAGSGIDGSLWAAFLLIEW